MIAQNTGSVAYPDIGPGLLQLKLCLNKKNKNKQTKIKNPHLVWLFQALASE